MITVARILELPVLSEARVVAGHQGLHAIVRWCHVSEVLDIARLLSGGEVVLTTGLALDVVPEVQRSFIKQLKAAGAAGVMLELGRQFQVAPPAMAQAAEEEGLPLVILPFDTKFVAVTEAVHRLILAEAGVEPGGLRQATARLAEDLLSGRIPDWDALADRLRRAMLPVPAQWWMCVVAIAGSLDEPGIRRAAAHELGGVCWFHLDTGTESHLVIFGAERSALIKTALRLEERLRPRPLGVGRPVQDPPAAMRSKEEALQTMRLRRTRPGLSPLFTETGAYQFSLFAPEDAGQFVFQWLGPLLEYDRLHRTDLCETLRLLLDDSLLISVTARRLHLTRQSVYNRRDRIAQILGRDLDDPETRLALALALRLAEARRAAEP